MKKLIQANNDRYLRSLYEKFKTNPKQFWSFYSLKSKSRRIPQAVSYENIIATDPTKKVELFNRCFRTVYSESTLQPSSCGSPSIVDVVNPRLLLNLESSEEAVGKILCNLNIHKATGVGGIPARILQGCARELAKPLNLLFNCSRLLQGRLPYLWKRVNISPVHKIGNKELVTNYRSISLLFMIPAKCLET